LYSGLQRAIGSIKALICEDKSEQRKSDDTPFFHFSEVELTLFRRNDQGPGHRAISQREAEPSNSILVFQS
jgi:hypothetical protein